MSWTNTLGSMNAILLEQFGTMVTYTPSGGTEFALRAILDQPAQPEQMAPGTYILLFCQTTDFPDPPANGDTVEADSISYTVVRIEADLGGGVLILARQA